MLYIRAHIEHWSCLPENIKKYIIIEYKLIGPVRRRRVESCITNYNFYARLYVMFWSVGIIIMFLLVSCWISFSFCCCVCYVYDLRLLLLLHFLMLIFNTILNSFFPSISSQHTAARSYTYNADTHGLLKTA